MEHAKPVTPNVPLLVSGLISGIVGVALPVFVMDWGAPDMGFAFAAVAMVLLILYGVVGIFAGLATVIPGISR
jgi:hypothetical protein